MNIYKDTEARKNVLEGAELIYEPVKTTLGPKGRNVLIKDKFGKFTVTHDGVTVAKSIQLKDDPRSIGVELVKEASRKMDEVGDGTTSVTVLTYYLIKLADELVEKGENPMMIKRELEAILPGLLEKIDQKAKKIEANHEDVKNVATVSVGDAVLGELVADLLSEVGFDGAVAVEQTKNLTTTKEVVEGYSFDRGYMSPYFANDTRSVTLKTPAIIVIKGTITELEDYRGVFDPLFENKIHNVLVIAENIEADALNSLILNKAKGSLNVVAVKAPGHGENKADNLKDIATITGASLIDPTVPNWQDQLGFNTLGAAEKIEVGFDETIIINGQGSVTDRVEKLKKRFKKAKIDEKEELEQRIAKLEGKVGIIRVGGATETEVEEKKYRIDDAVFSVKAALKDGIVAGGGVTLRDIGRTIEGEEQVETLVRTALCMPEAILLENSSIDGDERAMLKEGEGINVLTGDHITMIDEGIIDPVKVAKEVVRNAFTQAMVAISVGGAIVDEQLTQEQLTGLMSMGQ